MQCAESPLLSTENVAYWFFRLNGCLSIVNFLVHHERRGQEGTDVDILAVRFPYRSELPMHHEPMQDHPVFHKTDKIHRIDVILAEVKLGRCDLNGPWTDPKKQNMNRVLSAIGAFPKVLVPKVAKDLYEQKLFTDDQFRTRLFAVGQERNTRLSENVVQLTWNEVLTFIYERLKKYREIKAQHRQWDEHGQLLFGRMCEHRSAGAFVQDVSSLMGLKSDSPEI